MKTHPPPIYCSTHNIKSTMANLHNSKPTAPIQCTTTHHAPDPLRPRSEGFIARDTRMRGWFLTNTVFLFSFCRIYVVWIYGLGKFERFVIVFVQSHALFFFFSNLLRFMSNSVDPLSLSAGWFGKMFWAFTIKSLIKIYCN